MKFSCFEEADKEVARIYNEERFEEAIGLLEKMIDEYPDNLYTITWDMAVFYSLMTPKQIEKSMDILEYGNKKGLWYYLDPENVLWESFRGSARFQELVTKNKEKKEQAQTTARPQYEVCLPENYCEEKNYPLHIAIHGWGEDVAFFKKFWKSDKMNKEYISLFVQSSRIVNPVGFCWDDIELARKEIKEAYENVLAKYPIDTNSITIGGFSQGGTMALDFSLNAMIPITGFIALCPNQPNSLTDEALESMVERGIKGIILTGEKDGCLSEQKIMVEAFEETGFPFQFLINKNLGHWFPENLSEQIDEALDFINSEVRVEA